MCVCVCVCVCVREREREREREYKCSGYSVLISLIKKLTGVLIFTYLLNFVSILLLHW